MSDCNPILLIAHIAAVPATEWAGVKIRNKFVLLTTSVNWCLKKNMCVCEILNLLPCFCPILSSSVHPQAPSLQQAFFKLLFILYFQWTDMDEALDICTSSFSEFRFLPMDEISWSVTKEMWVCNRIHAGFHPCKAEIMDHVEIKISPLVLMMTGLWWWWWRRDSSWGIG